MCRCTLNRRAFLLGLAGTAALVACGGPDERATGQADGATTTAAPPPPSVPEFVQHAPVETNQIALTFHTNGDLKLAQQLLDTVNEHHTPITCFIVGNWLEANPSWAKKFTDGGHELANHTYTHPDFTTLSRAQMATEITKCRDVLRKVSGHDGLFFRPSGIDDGTVIPGADIVAEAHAAGYPYIAGFDVDPYDYRDPGATVVEQRTNAALRGGAVVSLHFGHPGTNQALPAILDEVRRRQLEPVTMSRLIGRG